MSLMAQMPGIPILMYHSISYCHNPRFRRFTVAPERFDEHLDYLSVHGFTPLSVSDYAQRIALGHELPPRPVILTFDDGYADFLSAALPLLQKYRFTATLYIITGYVGRTSMWLRREGEADRALLDWDQIREIAASGIECGAHTHTHRALDSLAEPDLQQEIMLSQRLLAENVGVPYSFAYPFGFYSRAARAMVQQAGFTSACAVRYALSSPHDDQFALARLIVTADTDISAFDKLLVSGRKNPGFLYLRLRASAWTGVRRGYQMVQSRVR